MFASLISPNNFIRINRITTLSLSFYINQFVQLNSHTRPDDSPIVYLATLRDFDIILIRSCVDRFLSREEVLRFNSYKQRSDQDRFVLSRFLIRSFLSAYLGQSISDVQILLDAFGKPYSLAPMHFNISHSSEAILLSFHPSCPVGIDLEANTAYPNWQKIANLVWDQSVVDHIKTQSVDSQPFYFLRCWCLYESIVKSFGTGFLNELPPGYLSAIRSWELNLCPDYLGFVTIDRSRSTK